MAVKNDGDYLVNADLLTTLAAIENMLNKRKQFIDPKNTVDCEKRF